MSELKLLLFTVIMFGIALLLVLTFVDYLRARKTARLAAESKRALLLYINGLDWRK